MLGPLGIVATILFAEGGSIDPVLRIGLIVLMLTVALSMFAAKRRRKTRTPDISAYVREQAAQVRKQQGVQDDMEQLFVQLSDLARQLNGQMDTRYAKMEQTLAEADARIATLEALLRKAAGVQGVDLTVDDRPAAESAAKTAAPPAKTPELPAANGAKPRKAGKKGPKADKTAQADPPPARTEKAPVDLPAAKDQAPPASPGDHRYDRIYELADRGLSSVEISRQTGQSTGEIELILNLRKSRMR